MSEGLKFDGGKLDWSVLDLELIEPLVEVLELGMQKYGYENWRKDFGPNYRRRFKAARLRHEKEAAKDLALMNHEDHHVYHLAQISVNALFQLYHELKELHCERSKPLGTVESGDGGEVVSYTN